MFVKICGLRNREDALAAVEFGAQALGFIFYPRSPRHVSPDDVGQWIHEIPSNIWKTGVYVDETPDTIEQISRQLGLDIAQLHGQETPKQYPHAIRVWKAIRVNGAAVEPLESPAEAILLDGPGSGRTFDWSVARGISKPIVVAGGLTPENVQSAIDATGAWGVDTASGVESAPGRKDHARMKLFIKAALRS